MKLDTHEQMSSTPGSEGPLDISSTVWRQVVVSFAAAL